MQPQSHRAAYPALAKRGHKQRKARSNIKPIRFCFIFTSFILSSKKLIGSGLTGLGERPWNKLRNWT